MLFQLIEIPSEFWSRQQGFLSPICIFLMCIIFPFPVLWLYPSVFITCRKHISNIFISLLNQISLAPAGPSFIECPQKSKNLCCTDNLQSWQRQLNIFNQQLQIFQFTKPEIVGKNYSVQVLQLKTGKVSTFGEDGPK